jgi:hypothetical protein
MGGDGERHPGAGIEAETVLPLSRPMISVVNVSIRVVVVTGVNVMLWV